jgi:hypothetical protein
MEKKICSKCKEEKEVCEFTKDSYNKDGYRCECKSCCKKRRDLTYYTFLDEHREKSRDRQKKYYQKNIDSIRVRNKKYETNRLKNDPEFRLIKNIRRRVLLFLQSNNITKNNKTFEIVGCTPQQLKEHIKSQFKDDMSWENYGYYGWHIDHIIPLSSAKNEDELYKLCHYTNLQPLWASDNLSKGDKIL